MKKLIMFLVLALTMSVGAGAQSTPKKGKTSKRVIFTTTPQMHCDNCEKKIQGNLRFEKGVKIIQIDRAQQLITITYDTTKTSPALLEKAFNKINYQVKVVDPNSLPDCCSGATSKQ